MAERLYSTYEVAELLGSPPSAVVEWMQKGWLPFERQSDGPVRISEKGLISFLKRQGIDIEEVLAKTIDQNDSFLKSVRDADGAPVEGVVVGEAKDDSDGDGDDGASHAAIEPATDVAASQAAPAQDAAGDASSPETADQHSRVGQTSAPGPVGQVIEAICQDAVARGASHIHLDRKGEAFSLRLRIGGVMHDKADFASRLPDGISSQLMDRLDGLADNGNLFDKTIDGRPVTFRLSRVMTASGGKIVLAVEDTKAVTDGLAGLNLPSEQEHLFRLLLCQPCGLLVVASPPRTGRDELFLAMAGELDRARRTVATVARPDRRRIEHVTVCQVGRESPSPATIIGDLVAADTDVIIVDELADAETVLASIEAARRGTLVVAGIAANDAPEGMELLLAAKPPVWPLAGSLLGVAALRMVRRLCPQCRKRVTPEPQFLTALGLSLDELGGSVYAAARCDGCGQTGYAGVMGVVSVIEVDRTVAGLLRGGGSADAVVTGAIEAGMKSLGQAAVEAVQAGVTSLEELARAFPKAT